MRTLDDTTPLNGGDLDVASRIGWAVRIARITARDAGDTRLQTMAHRLGSSPAHLSRIETGQRRDGLLTRLYEAALGIPDGSLGAPIATLCRTIPARAPRDSGPLTGQNTDVRDFSALTERMLSTGATVRGGEWLDWARALSMPGNIGLPLPLFARIAERLLDELDRSVEHATAPRYEAVAVIRRSRYGELMLEIGQTLLTPGVTRRPELLVSALCAAPARDALPWALALLGSEPTARWGAIALEALLNGDDGRLWHELAPTLVEAFIASPRGSEREWWVTHLLRMAPSALRLTDVNRLERRPPADLIDDWSPNSLNPHWAWAHRQADEIAASHDLVPQPILSRLIFDIVLGPWETRAISALLLLTGVPGLADTLPQRMAEHLATQPVSPVRRRVLERLLMVSPCALPAACAGWATSSDPLLRRAALDRSVYASNLVDDNALVVPVAAGEVPHQASRQNEPAQVPSTVVVEGQPGLASETSAVLARWRDLGPRVGV